MSAETVGAKIVAIWLAEGTPGERSNWFWDFYTSKYEIYTSKYEQLKVRCLGPTKTYSQIKGPNQIGPLV